MGLLQKAIETYDNMSHLAGVDQEGKVTLAPVGFISTKAQIIITLDLNGNFKGAERASREDEKIIIPVTEKSSGRSGSGAATTPHPLCEHLDFLLPKNKLSYNAYINQLETWCSVHPIPALLAVLKYVKCGTIENDLSNIKSDGKDTVCWKVLNSGTYDEIWRNADIQSAYREFYSGIIANNERAVCYVSGENKSIAEQHLKGIVPLFGNAKIISSNDTSNFTYLGRFIKPEEAASVGYEASQKAHNALKWLVENDGVPFGGRMFVVWSPNGINIPKPTSNLFSFENEDEKPTPSAFRKKLNEIIEGYNHNFKFDSRAVIAVFSAATTGRLSVTYYNEMTCSDFLERMRKWEEICCWHSSRRGTYSPSLKNIIDASFGTQRNGLIETDDRIKGEQIYRLLLCKIDGVLFPDDIMRYAVEKCGNLQIFEPANRDRQIFTTCAIVRKHLYDHKKEEWNMALEPELLDRSYQYGRLLAVLEKAERDTYDADEKRETNAIRLQPVFVKRPAYATQIILEQVKKACYPHLPIGARSYYEKLIGEIMSILSEFGVSERNRPLGETYLLGYYLQKTAFYTKKNRENETEDK